MSGKSRSEGLGVSSVIPTKVFRVLHYSTSEVSLASSGVLAAESIGPIFFVKLWRWLGI